MRRFLLAALAAIALASQVAADELPQPAGEPLLTISGKIAHANTPDGAVLDEAMLLAVPSVELRTSTPWTDGVPTFTGVKMSDLLALVGAEGTTVRAIALNDYEVSIPLSDFADFPVVLAYAMNGERLKVRDKGPLWIVYPRDDYADLRREDVNARWVWQLKALVIE